MLVPTILSKRTHCLSILPGIAPGVTGCFSEIYAEVHTPSHEIVTERAVAKSGLRFDMPLRRDLFR